MTLWTLSLGLGCSEPDVCEGAENPASQPIVVVGAKTLTCRDVDSVQSAVTLLAGRALQPRARADLRGAVRDRFVADPVEARSWISDVALVTDALWGAAGFEGAEKRSVEAWRAHGRRGPLSYDDPFVGNIVRDALSVWATADAEQWVLTEMDIEGWIAYASLCREAQNGGPLRLSVSDRAQLYGHLGTRFDEGDREVRRALVSLGPYWRHVAARWKGGTYEEQRRWIAAAPLPPPMSATSLAYAHAIFDGDLALHATVLHEQLGPLSMRASP